MKDKLTEYLRRVAELQQQIAAETTVIKAELREATNGKMTVCQGTPLDYVSQIWVDEIGCSSEEITALLNSIADDGSIAERWVDDTSGSLSLCINGYVVCVLLDKDTYERMMNNGTT